MRTVRRDCRSNDAATPPQRGISCRRREYRNCAHQRCRAKSGRPNDLVPPLLLDELEHKHLSSHQAKEANATKERNSAVSAHVVKRRKLNLGSGRKQARTGLPGRARRAEAALPADYRPLEILSELRMAFVRSLAAKYPRPIKATL
jgi:hypothetical protein